MNNNELIFENEFDKYIEYLSLTLKPTTILGIKRGFKKHILPHFTNRNIYTINEYDWFKWQNYIKSLGFSNSFNSNVQIIFKRFFDYLEKFYDIKNIPKKYGNFKTFNPDNKKELNIWNVSEYRKFIKCVDNNIYHALFNLLFLTGVRKGEALALRFSDIDNYYIYINKSITKDLFNNKHLEMTPKTKKSIRKIRIDKKLKNEINKLRKYYIKNFSNYNDNFYIFGGNSSISQTTLKRKKDYYCDLAAFKIYYYLNPI